MPRGGKRNGRPGASYPNRSDLNRQPVRTVPGQTYGQAGQQAAAQKAVPLPQSQPVPQQPFVPPDPGLLSAPSARPNEPVTAGVPIGAGPGPEALGPYSGPDDMVLAKLRAAYANEPNPGLEALIARMESQSAPRP